MAGVGGVYTIKVRGVLDEAPIRAQLASIGREGLIFGKGGKGAGGFSAIGKEAQGATKQVKQLSGAMGTVGKTAKQAPKLAGGMQRIGTAAKKAGQEVHKASKGMTGFAQSSLDVTKKVVQFGAVTAAIRGVTTGIGSMITQTFELDSALVEFKKVSDLSKQGLEEYTKQAYEAGEVTAKTGVEMIDAATQFKKMGYDEQTSLQLAKHATMFQNIADAEISAGDAAKFINSQMKAYQGEFGAFSSEGEKAAKVIDTVNEVANKNAVGTNDLQLALTKTSAAMGGFGNSFDEVVGIMTAGTEIMVGMPSQVARGWRTIGANVLQVAQKSDEYVAASGKVRIATRDQNGEMKNTYAIMKDLYLGVDGVSKSWKDLSKEEKSAIALQLAGKNNMEKFQAVMNNFGTAIKATGEAQKSQGSATKENAKYLDSLEGKLQGLKSAWSRFSNAMIKSDTLKSALSGLTKVIDFFASDTGQSLLKVAGYMTAFGLGLKLVGKISGGITTKLADLSKNGFGKLGGAVSKTAGTAGKATGRFSKLASIFSGGAVGWGILGATGLAYGFYKLHEYLTDKYNPENIYNKTKSDLDKVNDALKENKERRAEIEQKVADGTATQEEKNELKVLERQVEVLKEKKKLLEKKEKKDYADKERGKSRNDKRKTLTSDLPQQNKLEKQYSKWQTSLKNVKKAQDEVKKAEEELRKAQKSGDQDRIAKAQDALIDANAEYGKTLGKTTDKYDAMKKKQAEWLKEFGSVEKMPKDLRETYEAVDKVVKAYEGLAGVKSFDAKKLGDKGVKKALDDFKALGKDIGVITDKAGKIKEIDYSSFVASMDAMGFSAKETQQALALISKENPEAKINIEGVDVATEHIGLVMDYLDKLNGDDPEATVKVNGVDVAVSEIGSVENLVQMLNGERATPNVEFEGMDEAQKQLDTLTEGLSETDKKSFMASIGVEGAVDTKDEIDAVNKAYKKFQKKKPVEVGFKTKGAKETKETVDDINKAPSQKNIGVNVSGEVEPTVGEATRVLNLPPIFQKWLKVSGKDDGASTVVNDINKKKIPKKTMKVAGKLLGSFTTAKSSYEGVKDKKTTVSIGGKLASSFSSAVSKLKEALGLKGKNATGTRNAPEGLSEVNEQGWEFIRDAKTGKLRVAGGGKRTITYLNKGDAVYTHAESKRMLSDKADIEIPQHAKGKKGKKSQAKKKAQESYNKKYNARKSKYEAAIDTLEYNAAMQHWTDKQLADAEKKAYDKHVKALQKWNKSKAVKKLIKKGAKVKKSFGKDAYRERMKDVESAKYDIRTDKIEQEIENLGLKGGDPYIDKGEADSKIKSLQSLLKKKKISADDYKKYYAEINKAYLDSAMKMYSVGKKNYKDMKADLDVYVKAGKITWAEYYDYINELMEEQLDKEREALEKKQELNDNEYSLGRAYVQRQIDLIQKRNEQQEEQNELIEKQSELERARSQKVKIYRQGVGFVYEQDTEAIREATQALQEYKKEQEDPELKAWQDILDLLDDYEQRYEIKQLEQKTGINASQFFGSMGVDKDAWSAFIESNRTMHFGIESLLEKMDDLKGWEAIQSFLGSSGSISDARIASAASYYSLDGKIIPAPIENVVSEMQLPKSNNLVSTITSGLLGGSGLLSSLGNMGGKPLQVAKASNTGTIVNQNFDNLVLPNINNAEQFLHELNNLANKAIQEAWKR